MTSPTQRTLEFFRKLGFTCEVVERWNPYSKTRQDLFGVIDILAVYPLAGKPGIGICGIQATSAANMSARVHKIHESVLAKKWLEAGGKIYVVGWRKKKVGNRAVWMPRVLQLDDEGHSWEINFE